MMNTILHSGLAYMYIGCIGYNTYVEERKQCANNKSRNQAAVHCKPAVVDTFCTARNGASPY